MKLAFVRQQEHQYSEQITAAVKLLSGVQRLELGTDVHHAGGSSLQVVHDGRSDNSFRHGHHSDDSIPRVLI